MISNSLLQELNIILIEEYGFNFTPSELQEIASSFIGFFELLIVIKNEELEKNILSSR